MNSSLVPGTAISVYDDSLQVAIGFDDTVPIIYRSAFLIGIENEFGQVYRLVGIEDLKALFDVLNRLRRLNYVVDNMQAETVGDLTAIVKVPRY